jgi:predicted amidophosphoribosyltransferase
MATSHCPRCGRPKSSEHFACRPCWFSLPRKIRDRIWRAFRRHGVLSDEWLDARDAAYEWWGLPTGAKAE